MFTRMLRTRGAAQTNRVGNLRQFIGHERHVRGLERGVAPDGAHGNPDVGGGERRRVVDAVADHRNRAVRASNRLHSGYLVGRQRPDRTSSIPIAAPTARAAAS